MAEMGLVVARTLHAALQCSKLRQVCTNWGYESQLEDLNQSVSTINDLLHDAESKLLSHEALGYVEELKDAVYEADDLFDEFVTLLETNQLQGSLAEQVRCFFSSNSNLQGTPANYYDMFCKVEMIQKKLNVVINNQKKFALDVDYEPICLRGEETISSIHVNDIIGREDDKKAIIEKLLESKDQDVRFLTVVGVGGVGKTALAQLVYNDENIKQQFADSRFWVCVSDQDKQRFDVIAIIRKILRLISYGERSFDGYHELQPLKLEFQKVLEGKKYLLVLDDVWNEDHEKWVDLLEFLLVGVGGSRVLVTTRSEITAATIGDGKSYYRLEALSLENAWKLFEMEAAYKDHHQEVNHSELEKIGNKIVERCHNVPLAIKVIGSLLYGQDINKWRLFESSGLSEIDKDENQIMPILKLSYHSLETSLKSCFAYFAIFPKDYVIQRKMLINLWVAQGYIKPTHGGQSIDAAAEEHFLILLRRCFFQYAREDDNDDAESVAMQDDIVSVKMHDLMHDVAQEVGGEEIQILSSGANNSFTDKARHLSFTSYHICPQSSYLRTMLRSYIQLPSRGSESVPVALHKFINLRVLTINFLDDNKLLDSIGELLHLRYLDLSNSYFETFPANSITKLHNLQTFILFMCYKLKELPHDMSKLVKLRHLDISHCTGLTCMSSGMSKLTSLRVLTDFYVGKGNPTGKHSLKDLENLTNLTGRINISIGPHYKNEEQPTNSSYLSQMKHLKEVHIFSCDLEAVLEKLEPPSNTKKFFLQMYNGTTIPWWQKAENNRIISHNLVFIYFHSCTELQTMPSFSTLPHLKSLILFKLDKLEYMEKISSSGTNAEAKQTTIFFPSLRYLNIGTAPRLKGWFSADHCLNGVRFPHLSHLEITYCPNLASFPPCPSIKTLHCEKSKILQQVVGKGKGTSCLTTLTIDENGELKSLSELSNVFMTCASSLRSLRITHCHNLVSISDGLEHLNVLESLQLSWNDGLNFSEDDIMESWKSFHQSLRTLKFERLANMTSLPKGMQHLKSLQTLHFMCCDNLKSLPEWISCLTSLQYLQILENDCKIFQERCSKPNGADWPKIQHIPNIITDTAINTVKDLMDELKLITEQQIHN